MNGEVKHWRLAPLAAAILSVFFTPVVWSEDTNWTGTTNSSWSEVANWDAGVPEAGDNATIAVNGAVVDYDAISDPTLTTLNVWSGATLQHYLGTALTTQVTFVSGLIDQTTGTHTINNPSGDAFLSIDGGGVYQLSGDAQLIKGPGEEKIGGSGLGTFSQDGTSTHSFQGALYLGDQAGSLGQYALHNGTFQGAGMVLGEWGGTGWFFQDAGSVSLNDLTLGRQNEVLSGPGTGYYELNGGILAVSGLEVIGARGNGEVVQNGGGNTTDGLILGNEAGSDGTYDLGGTGVLEVLGDEWVGKAGIGTFSQSDATTSHTIRSNLFVGGGVASKGVFNLYDGTLQVDGAALVGNNVSATGEFNQSGGMANVEDTLVLGAIDGATGVYDLSGSGLLFTEGTDVGSAGSGDFGQGGGTHSVDGNLVVGREATATGTYDLTAGQVESIETHVGAFGTGTFTHSGGNHDSDTLVLGYNSGGEGAYELSDGQLIALSERIGLEGTGTFSQSGGTNDVDGSLVLGQESGSRGTYYLDGGSLSVDNDAVVGAGGEGLFFHTDGTHEVGSLLLGDASSGEGYYGLEGAASVLTVAGSERIGREGQAEFSQSGGTHTVHGDLTIGAADLGDGSYNLGGDGSLQVDGMAHLGNGVGAEGDFFLGEDGTANLDQGLILGVVAGSVGRVQMETGAPTLTTGWTHVGSRGVGRFDQFVGEHTTGTLILGVEGTGNGTYGLYGGTLTDTAIVGDAGTGTFDNTGGTHNVDGALILGNQQTGDGEYNLSGTGVLNVADSTIVGNAGTGTFTQSGTSNHAITGGLILGSQAVSDGHYAMYGGSLQAGGVDSIIGDAGQGSFVQNAGSVNLPFLKLGNAGTGDGSYTLNGGNLTSGFVGVGLDGVGVMIQNGGNHQAHALTMGANPAPGSSGSYDLSGGTLAVTAYEHVGLFSTATFNQIGGSNATGELVLGYETSGVGTYNLSGTGSLAVTGVINVGHQGQGDFTLAAAPGAALTAGGMIIGDYGTGTFTQDGGTSTVTGEIRLGHFDGGQGTYTQTGGDVSASGVILGVFGPGSEGTYKLEGGTLTTTSGGMVLGYEGQGTFEQTGGTVDLAESLHLGEKAGSSGTYTLSGATSLLRVRGVNEIVGVNGGIGQFTQQAGTHTVDNRLYVGGADGATGTYDLQGGSLDSNITHVGSGSATSGGTGVFNNSGGMHIVSRLGLGAGQVAGPGGNGTYNLSGSGSLQASDRIAVGAVPGGVGVFNQTGGTVTGNVNLAELPGSTGTYNLSGGSLSAPNLNVNAGGTLNYSGGSLSTTSGLTNNGQMNLSGGGIRTVAGDVVNNGMVKVTDTIANWTGTFTNAGVYNSDPSSNTFANLAIDTTGYLLGGAGDRFLIGGNFENRSTQGNLWDTMNAFLTFTGVAPQTFLLAGADKGAGPDAFANNFAWDVLFLGSGIDLLLGDGNMSNAGTALYVGAFLLEGDQLGLLSQVTGNGANIYYNRNDARNAYLLGGSYGLTGGGSLNPFDGPSGAAEPGTLALLGLGLAGLGRLRRRR